MELDKGTVVLKDDAAQFKGVVNSMSNTQSGITMLRTTDEIKVN